MKVSGEDSEDVAKATWEIAVLLMENGRAEEARERASQCYEIYLKIYGKEHELCINAADMMKEVDRRDRCTTKSGITSILEKDAEPDSSEIFILGLK